MENKHNQHQESNHMGRQKNSQQEIRADTKKNTPPKQQWLPCKNLSEQQEGSGGESEANSR